MYEKGTHFGQRFGGILADLDFHFEHNFNTFRVLEARKLRSCENMKMSTAPGRDAHIRVLTRFKIRQKLPKTDFWTRRCGDIFVDDHLGTFGRILGSKRESFFKNDVETQAEI